MSHEALLKHVSDRVDAIYYTLHGNGEPGLKTRVDRLEQLRLADVKKRDGQAAWVKLIVGIVITAVVSNSVALGFVLYRQPVKAEQGSTQGR